METEGCKGCKGECEGAEGGFGIDAPHQFRLIVIVSLDMLRKGLSSSSPYLGMNPIRTCTHVRM